MTDQSTSLAAANSMRAEWRLFAVFLKKPYLPPRMSGIGGSGMLRVFRLLALDLAIMLGLVAIAMLVVATGVELPTTAIAEMELDTSIVLLAVFAAPIIEEIVFRGWLSGRPGAIFSVLVLFAGGITAGALGSSGSTFAALGPAIAAVGMAAILAIVIVVMLRKRPAFAFFKRYFPVFFWLSTLAFALLHLTNFAEGPLYALLPLVLPQTVLGMIAGYLRVTTGLWANIALHVLHNGIAIGAVLLGSQVAS